MYTRKRLKKFPTIVSEVSSQIHDELTKENNPSYLCVIKFSLSTELNS